MTIDRVTVEAADVEEINHLRAEVAEQGRCIRNWVRNAQGFVNELDKVLPGACEAVQDEGSFGPGLAQWIGKRVERMIDARPMPVEEVADDS